MEQLLWVGGRPISQHHLSLRQSVTGAWPERARRDGRQLPQPATYVLARAECKGGFALYNNHRPPVQWMRVLRWYCVGLGNIPTPTTRTINRSPHIMAPFASALWMLSSLASLVAGHGYLKSVSVNAQTYMAWQVGQDDVNLFFIHL